MSKENEIVNCIDRDKINIGKVDRLFKEGADPNYIDDDECLFVSCIWNAADYHPDLYPLLKCFIENGLDVNRFANEILGEFIFINDKKSDLLAMAKLILNNINGKISLAKALDSIDGEASYYRVSFEHEQVRVTRLVTLSKILHAYQDDEPYDNIFYYDRAIGQKLITASITGDFLENDTVCASWKTGNKIRTMLKLENDVLVVDWNDDIYVNNDAFIEADNEFSKAIVRSFKGQTLRRVFFERYSIQIAPKGFMSGFTTSILFSNERMLRYKNGLVFEGVWIDFEDRR